MYSLDIAIVLILILSAIFGILCGFFNIMSSVIIWPSALSAATVLNPILVPLLFESPSNILKVVLLVPMQKVLAFVIAFIISIIVFKCIFLLVGKLLANKHLSGIDKMLGGIFGTVFGAMLVTLLIFLAGFTSLPQSPWWDNAVLIMIFERISVSASEYLPEVLSQLHGY